MFITPMVLIDFDTSPLEENDLDMVEIFHGFPISIHDGKQMKTGQYT